MAGEGGGGGGAEIAAPVARRKPARLEEVNEAVFDKEGYIKAHAARPLVADANAYAARIKAPSGAHKRNCVDVSVNAAGLTQTPPILN